MGGTEAADQGAQQSGVRKQQVVAWLSRVTRAERQGSRAEIQGSKSGSLSESGLQLGLPSS